MSVKKIFPTLLTVFILLCLCGWYGCRSYQAYDRMSDVKMTVDEAVYIWIGMQLIENPYDYSATGYALFNEKTRERDLPSYFYRPLFKHPPLFSYSQALSLNFIPHESLRFIFPSLLAGILMIPLAFGIGLLLNGRLTGLLAALITAMDPVRIMCSQKIWMDTMLGFFMVLGIYLFLLAMHKKKDGYFTCSGLVLGLAGLVKYPGLLAWFAVLVYVALYRREVLRKSRFLFAAVLPVLMQLPWIGWNIRVYGWGFLTDPFAQHGGFRMPIVVILIGMAVLMFLFVFFTRFGKKPASYRPDRQSRNESVFLWILRLGVLLALGVFLIKDYGLQRFAFFNMPHVTWAQGYFSGAPRIFYIGRMIQFNYVYLLGFIALIVPFPKGKGSGLLKTYMVIVLLFFILWGNYQSRYILALIPVLAVFSSSIIVRSLKIFAEFEPPSLRLTLQSVLLIMLVLALSRTAMINHLVSFTNDMCYF
ncbi:MAG: ArnT family glycosyltransferase [Candidatus Omnitrophota bacterium]